MRNKHPGTCYRCGKYVAKGEGHFEKVCKDHFRKWPALPPGTQWLVQHALCARKYRYSNQHYIYADIAGVSTPDPGEPNTFYGGLEDEAGPKSGM